MLSGLSQAPDLEMCDLHTGMDTDYIEFTSIMFEAISEILMIGDNFFYELRYHLTDYSFTTFLFIV